jgi:hypothetical protein
MAAAVDLVRDEVAVRAALGEVGTLIEQRRWGLARTRLDALAPRFDPVLSATFTLPPEPSEDAREVVATVTDLRRIFVEHRAVIDGDHTAPLDPEDRRIGLACFQALADESIAGRGPDIEAEERRAIARCAREAGVSRVRADRAYEAWVAAGMPGAATVRPGR